MLRIFNYLTTVHIDLHGGFYLSPIQDGDQAAYVEHFADKATVDCLLLIPYPYTEQDAQTWVKSRMESSLKRPRETQFALRREDGFLVGGTGLVLGSGAGAHQAELGYWVAKDYRRRGLASASIQAMCHLAFYELGLQHVQARLSPANTSSQHILEKAGFKREGPFAAYHLKNGVSDDTIIYGLVKSRNEE